MKNKTIYYVLLVICLAIFIIKISRVSTIENYFQLHTFRDGSSYLARLHFLSEYGYNQPSPRNYIDSIKFQVSWEIFTLPFYKLTKSINVTALTSILFSLIVSFITIFYFSRKLLSLNPHFSF